MKIDPKPLDVSLLQLNLKGPEGNKKLEKSRELFEKSPQNTYIFRVLTEENGKFYSDSFCKVTPEEAIIYKNSGTQTDKSYDRSLTKAQKIYIDSLYKKAQNAPEECGLLIPDKNELKNHDAVMIDVQQSQIVPDSYLNAFLKVSLMTTLLVSSILLLS